MLNSLNLAYEREIFVLSRKDYIKTSLELNLFFGRIMKEHMIFMEVGLLIIDSSLILEGDQLKSSFEKILLETIALSKGAISRKVLESEELVTPLTLNSETISSGQYWYMYKQGNNFSRT